LALGAFLAQTFVRTGWLLPQSAKGLDVHGSVTTRQEVAEEDE